MLLGCFRSTFIFLTWDYFWKAEKCPGNMVHLHSQAGCSYTFIDQFKKHKDNKNKTLLYLVNSTWHLQRKVQMCLEIPGQMTSFCSLLSCKNTSFYKCLRFFVDFSGKYLFYSSCFKVSNDSPFEKDGLAKNVLQFW